MIRYIRDWTWVRFVYVCGKMLRIKKYRPIVTKHASGMDLVRFSFPITASRLTKLTHLWEYRMATLEEAKQLANQIEEPKPNMDWLNDDWNHHRFLPVRK